MDSSSTAKPVVKPVVKIIQEEDPTTATVSPANSLARSININIRPIPHLSETFKSSPFQLNNDSIQNSPSHFQRNLEYSDTSPTNPSLESKTNSIF